MAETKTTIDAEAVIRNDGQYIKDKLSTSYSGEKFIGSYKIRMGHTSVAFEYAIKKGSGLLGKLFGKRVAALKASSLWGTKIDTMILTIFDTDKKERLEEITAELSHTYTITTDTRGYD